MYVYMYVYVSMHVCMYVCMYYIHMNICMYVCMHVCMYVHTYERMYVLTYVCMYVCMYVCIYSCMHVFYKCSLKLSGLSLFFKILPISDTGVSAAYIWPAFTFSIPNLAPFPTRSTTSMNLLTGT